MKIFKNGYKIRIKKKNKGKFTEYCNGKVTDECIKKAKNSGNPVLVKRATFALNVRKWKHQFGGLIIKAQGGTELYNSYVNPQSIEGLIAKTAVLLVDPTGFFSYPDVKESIDNYMENPSLSNTGWLTLDAISAIPLLGKIVAPAKVLKAAKTAAKIERSARGLSTISKAGKKAINKNAKKLLEDNSLVHKGVLNVNKTIDTVPELFPLTRKVAEKTQDFTTKFITQPAFNYFSQTPEMYRKANATVDYLNLGRVGGTVNDVRQYNNHKLGGKMNIIKALNGTIFNNQELINSAINGISNIILANKKLKATDLFVEAKEAEMKSFKAKTWKEKYMESLAKQNDRSDIVNMSRAYNQTSNDVAQEVLEKQNQINLEIINAQLEAAQAQGDALEGLLKNVGAMNALSKNGVPSSKVNTSTNDSMSNSIFSNNLYGLVNSNGSINLGFGNTWNPMTGLKTSTFGGDLLNSLLTPPSTNK